VGIGGGGRRPPLTLFEPRSRDQLTSIIEYPTYYVTRSYYTRTFGNWFARWAPSWAAPSDDLKSAPFPQAKE